MKKEKKTLKDFEVEFGGEKIKKLEQDLAIEKRKVEVLADVQHKRTIIKTKDNTFKFSIISDTHFGSLHHDNASLRAFFEYAQKQGIRNFYHAGDVLEGHKVYKGQEFEVREVGLEPQIVQMKKECPDLASDTTIYFIDGNHDNSYKKLIGYPTGKIIENDFSGWKYLGIDSADIEFKTENGSFLLRINHPSGGSAYQLSYKIQRRIEQISGGKKPNLLALGHYHKTIMLPSYRNVLGILAGCFQAQTPFMESKGSAAHLGGWIFEISVGKDKHNIYRSEFVAFYE